MIDTKVPGSPADVDAAALWLREWLRLALDDASDSLAEARTHAASDWTGRAAGAYGSLAAKTMVLLDGHSARVGASATVLAEYADLLRSVKAYMRDYRCAARAGGLTVVDAVIQPPEASAPVPSMPVDPAAAEQAEQDRRLAAQDLSVTRAVLYDRLADEVAAQFQALDAWISSYLRPALAHAEDDGGTNPLWDFVLGNKLSLQSAFAFTVAGRVAARRLAHLDARAATLQREAAELRRLGRSGSPTAARRSKEALREAESILDQIKWGTIGRRLLGPGSVLVEGWLAKQAIEDGESPGKVLMVSVAGTAATAATAAAVGTTSIPAVAVGVAAVAAGAAAGVIVNHQWERAPESVTDPVDQFVERGWHAVKGWATG